MERPEHASTDGGGDGDRTPTTARRDLTRDADDRTADVYVSRIGTELTAGIESPADLELLDRFARRLPVGARVADLGCGPGRAAARLTRHGFDVAGVDLSHGMLAEARRHHTGIPVAQADLANLPLRSGAFDAAILWYSIVHTPLDELPGWFREVRRALTRAGSVIVAFQAGGGESLVREEIAGRPVSLLRLRHAPDSIAGALTESGFHVETTVVRDPVGEHEDGPQAFVVARIPG